MRQIRTFLDAELIEGKELQLDERAAAHVVRVLRRRVGDRIHVFNGRGTEAEVELVAVERRGACRARIETVAMVNRESPVRIELIQAVARGEKMDWVVQKATELGVAEIIPIRTQRSVAKLAPSRADKRALHWHNVAVAACEQCGRNELPRLHVPREMQEWLQESRGNGGGKFILLPGGAGGMQAQPRPPGGVTLLIGPEGGFTGDEANVAQQAGFVPILLGPRVLRTETAALAGIAAIQTLWGDFQ